jgi:hypothetical protein
VPAQFLYYAPFAALALAYWLVMSRKRQNLKASTSSMQVGEVSRQLGMTLLKGDPEFHLAMDATPSMGATGVLLSGTRLPYSSATTEILARGTLDGRTTELYFYAKASAGVRIGLGRDVEVDRVCRLSVTPRTPVADFELVLRQPQAGAEADRILLDATALRFGEARLDQRYQKSLSASDVSLCAASSSSSSTAGG